MNCFLFDFPHFSFLARVSRAIDSLSIPRSQAEVQAKADFESMFSEINVNNIKTVKIVFSNSFIVTLYNILSFSLTCFFSLSLPFFVIRQCMECENYGEQFMKEFELMKMELQC